MISLDESNKIKFNQYSVEWFTTLGPISFSITEAMSKADTDITDLLDLI